MAQESVQARRLAVVGAGAWGTALAQVAAQHGGSISLWGRDAGHMARMQRCRQNADFLPGLTLADNIAVSSDLTETCHSCTDVCLVVPSDAVMAVVRSIYQHAPTLSGLVLASKGLSRDGDFLLQAIARFWPELKTAVLSGPSFAQEVAKDLPTAVVVASEDDAYARQVGDFFHQPCFRVYHANDVIGVQLCGAMKNVYAIAAGIADALGYGANTRAALITRGLAEMQRLGAAMGAQAATFMGLAGTGDLILTCTDNQSRNRSLGQALVQAGSLQAALHKTGKLAEGVKAAPILMRLASRYGVDLPIVVELERVLAGVRSPRAAVESLLDRAPGYE